MIQTQSGAVHGIQAVKKITILGVTFPVLGYEDTLKIFQEWVLADIPHQVCIANVHTVVSCRADAELRHITNNSMATMDGLPLVWYAKYVNNVDATRVCGPDLMLKCLDVGQARGWKHYFLGGRNEVLEELVFRTRQQFPRAELVGHYSPPFRPLSPEEDQVLVDRINQSGADFLWVGLGAPKQEKWIAAHLDRIKVPVQLGVGAAFDFHSGYIRRAPIWMQRSGLEWVYRVIKDKRLVKRYLTTNPRFLMCFVVDLVWVRLFKINR
ncbi:hypothetical protein A1355_01280 [Methylomonas koyamae]|uniref:Glycosyl transferase n=1 Tax=Methylomonas koyamae TaxID=702114 RepID=A0A177PE60_9GAMM|nr:hypothetical protein A1355_01280 [Methylomonas koyamae]